MIEASPHDPAVAYLAATRYKLDDFAPYLYKTNDYGKSWTKIVSGIPDDHFTRVIREDPNCRGLLYGGTEAGMYVSFDDGANWQPLQLNLPIVPIHDLEVRGTDLVAATHGRSFWVIDDVSPLHQLGDANGKTHLLKPRTTVQFKTARSIAHPPSSGKSYTMVGSTMATYRMKKNAEGKPEPTYLDAGENPPDGVVVFYSLKDKPEGEVKLTFLDAHNNEIKSFVSKPDEEPKKEDAATEDEEDKDEEPNVSKEAGLNRFEWDMRYANASKVPGDKSMRFVGGVKGPIAIPGTYQVQLTIGDETQTQFFEIVKDPRVPTSQEDLQAQFAFLTQVRDKVSETHDAINRIRTVRGQVEAWEKRAKESRRGEKVVEAAKQLKDELTAIEEELIQVKAKSTQDTLNFPIKLNAKVAGLAGYASGATSKPPQQAYDSFDDLAKKINVQLTKLNEVLGTSGEEFNWIVKQADLPAVELG